MLKSQGPDVVFGGRTTIPLKEPVRLQGLAAELGKVWNSNAASEMAVMMPIAFVRGAIVTIPLDL